MNGTTLDGYSALQLAVIRRNSAVAQELVMAGIDKERKDPKGNTALHLGVRRVHVD